MSLPEDSLPQTAQAKRHIRIARQASYAKMSAWLRQLMSQSKQKAYENTLVMMVVAMILGNRNHAKCQPGFAS